MPTLGGLPRAGETWELQPVVQGEVSEPVRVVIVRRGGGGYWSLTVRHVATGREVLWVDAPYFLHQGWLRQVTP